MGGAELPAPIHVCGAGTSIETGALLAVLNDEVASVAFDKGISLSVPAGVLDFRLNSVMKQSLRREYDALVIVYGCL